MAGITLTDAEAQLAAWLNASLAVAKGQEWKMGDQTLTRADAAEIRNQIKYWQGQVNKLTRGSIRVRRAIPLG